jgi:hypothetical protein
MTIAPDTGLDGFLSSLRRCGMEGVVEAGVVAFAVEPLGGVRAGTAVPTGVGVDELSTWPAVPPHWAHFPNDVRFPASNTQPSSRAGWTKHSRNIPRWGNAAEPGQAWLAHARAIAGEAVG